MALISSFFYLIKTCFKRLSIGSAIFVPIFCQAKQMGITKNCVKFLVHAKNMGVDYSSTVTLGRQQLYASESDVLRNLPNIQQLMSAERGFAEPFFSALGARQVDALDYSTYEDANVIHDLNKPLPEHLKGKYSAVFDGGTLEHVFNFPMAIRNCMDLLAIGGHFISITPCNNQCGHGFYQFSPELFYSVFSEDHGFKMITMILAVDVNKNTREWYEVVDPRVVG